MGARCVLRVCSRTNPRPFLPEPSEFADSIRDPRERPIGVFDMQTLADCPANVVAGKIGDSKRSHGEPNVSSALSISSGNAPSSSRKSICRKYEFNMRLPMKPSQTPATTPIFLICFAMARLVASTSSAVLFHERFPAACHVGGLKKCSPTTSPGRACSRNVVEIKSRGIGGEYRARLDLGIEDLEHLLLHLHVSNTASITRSARAMSS